MSLDCKIVPVRYQEYEIGLLKINFIAKSKLLYVACPFTRERKEKKIPILLTRQCLLTGMCKYRV